VPPPHATARPPAVASRASQRPHRDHGDSELLGERQDARLALALGGVVRHLDGREAAGAKRRLKLGEGAAVVVRDADPAHLAAFAGLLEPGKVLPPGDEVVDLLDLDVAVPLELAG
jgi:hypothetical protein